MWRAFRSERALWRAAAPAIIAGALLMRLLVPQGWMPVETARGWRLTICTGSGPMAMPGMRGAHDHRDGRDHGAGDHPCAFSSAATALDVPPPPVTPAPRSRTMATRLPGAAGVVAIGAGLAAPPPPSTGPPVHA